MPGKFVLKKVKTGYHFVLKASNGETIAQSEVYNSSRPRRTASRRSRRTRRTRPSTTRPASRGSRSNF
jgi:Domain of unknown function (DUF1508)